MGESISLRSEAAQVPFQEVLRVLRAEIADLADTSNELQEIAGALMVAAREAGGPAFIEKVQSLDMVVQRLSALSIFLHALMPSVPGHWEIDPGPAANLITLSDLAQRLGADATAEALASASEAVASGDFEIL